MTARSIETIGLGPVVPILRMFDIDVTRAFYLDYLGFTVDWEHRFAADLPLYLQINRGGVVLHLSQHHGDATPGSAVRVDCSDVTALKAELDGKSYRFMRPGIETPPWGGRELSVRDPSSNRIVFVERAATTGAR